MIKYVGAYLLGCLANIYTAIVAMFYWNWFVVPSANLHPISFLGMVGVIIFVRLISNHLFRGTEFINEQKWNLVFGVLPLCVSSENSEQYDSVVSNIEMTWSEAVGVTTTYLCGLTTTLAFGLFINVLSQPHF